MAEEKYQFILDGNVATWEMRLDGNISGTYTGTFKFRCFLTPLQKIAANREMRELLGSHMTMAPEHEANLAFALTQLKHRVISAPPFWGTNGTLAGDLPDANVVMEVLDASIEAELKYMQQIKQKKLDAIERAKKAAEQMLSDKPEDDLEEDQEG